MPIEANDYFIIDDLQLIRELYAEGKYLEGIKKASILKNNLKSSAYKKKFYCNICKLLGLGYRKIRNFQSANATLSDGINFCDTMARQTGDKKWSKESAILRVNRGIVFEEAGNISYALNEYFFGETVFNEESDSFQLSLLYQTIILALCKTHETDKAELYLNKLQRLAESSHIQLDNEINLLSSHIKEAKIEDD